MISLDEATKSIQQHFPGAKPKAAYNYKDKFYLIMAPSMKNDMNDPMYIVDIATGKYRFLNPLEDIDAFNKSIEDGPIKVFE